METNPSPSPIGAQATPQQALFLAGLEALILRAECGVRTASEVHDHAVTQLRKSQQILQDAIALRAAITPARRKYDPLAQHDPISPVLSAASRGL